MAQSYSNLVKSAQTYYYAVMDLNAQMRARLVGNSELARAIGVTPSMVGHMRSGRSQGSPATRRAAVEFLSRFPIVRLEDPGSASLAKPAIHEPAPKPAELEYDAMPLRPGSDLIVYRRRRS